MVTRGSERRRFHFGEIYFGGRSNFILCINSPNYIHNFANLQGNIFWYMMLITGESLAKVGNTRGAHRLGFFPYIPIFDDGDSESEKKIFNFNFNF